MSEFEYTSVGGRLSPREQEVVAMLAHGYTNIEVAERLVISVRTAESHRANAMTKLGVHTRAELVAWALRHGILVQANLDERVA